MCHRSCVWCSHGDFSFFLFHFSFLRTRNNFFIHHYFSDVIISFSMFFRQFPSSVQPMQYSSTQNRPKHQAEHWYLHTERFSRKWTWISSNRTIQNINIFTQNHPDHQAEYLYLQPKPAITSDWTLLPTDHSNLQLKPPKTRTYKYNNFEHWSHKRPIMNKTLNYFK